MTTDTPGSEPAEATDEAPEGESEPGHRATKDRKQLPIWQETLLLLGLALVLAIVIKALFVQAFYIPSESMEPGLVRNDRILVQKVSYWFGNGPSRGDVVVFEDPGGWLSAADEAGPTGFAKGLSWIGLYPTGGHLVKRVIGTPGDVVSCCDKQGRIEVNGVAIDESGYLASPPGSPDAPKGTPDACAAPVAQGLTRKGSDFTAPCDWEITVPEGKLFVLGDNRMNSADSRAHLCAPKEDPCTKSPWVDEDLVVGKVFALVWPQDRWDWISRPEAFDDVPDEAPSSK